MPAEDYRLYIIVLNQSQFVFTTVYAIIFAYSYFRGFGQVR